MSSNNHHALLWGRYSFLFYPALLSILGFVLFITGWVKTGLVVGLLSFAIWLFAIYDWQVMPRAILGNYPILARMRFFLESVRPELRQYFWESDTDKVPYSRNERSLVYQRAKNVSDVHPFGSLNDMYANDFVWLNHSLLPSHVKVEDLRVRVGEHASYAMSVLNISGTSFGALSPTAIEALNKGAYLGGFAHNTGEGSISHYHRKGGGDLIWQIGTGYFGCRDTDGNFCPHQFEKRATSSQVKMIEIKLSQGAKPGHGGMLLGAKVDADIAEARGVPIGEDCISPNRHSAFSTPAELLNFAQQLRQLSGGKPVGIKLAIGHPWEFIAIVKAMHTEQKFLDFITVDGAEGGTGAAPLEFTDNMGSPLVDGLVFVDNCLKGAGLRDRVKVGASGHIVSAFDIARVCSLGADWVNMARPFMFTLGCIQARACHTNDCPSGVATNNPNRYRVIDIHEKSHRAANFHKNTVYALKELLEAVGVQNTQQLNRRHIVRRLSNSEIKLADQIFPKVEDRALLTGGQCDDPRLNVYWNKTCAESFHFMAEQTEEQLVTVT